MWIFLVGGVVAYFSLNQEEFPDIELGLLQVSVPYLGATPEESETGVCLRLEEALMHVSPKLSFLLRNSVIEKQATDQLVQSDFGTNLLFVALYNNYRDVLTVPIK